MHAISGHSKATGRRAARRGRHVVFTISLEAVGNTGKRTQLSSEISAGSLVVQISLASKINMPHQLCKLRFLCTSRLSYLMCFYGNLPPTPPHHLSRHLITVSFGDANSTLMFPFVRVSCQSLQKWNNYRQLFLLIIFLTPA